MSMARAAAMTCRKPSRQGQGQEPAKAKAEPAAKAEKPAKGAVEETKADKPKPAKPVKDAAGSKPAEEGCCAEGRGEEAGREEGSSQEEVITSLL